MELIPSWNAMRKGVAGLTKAQFIVSSLLAVSVPTKRLLAVYFLLVCVLVCVGRVMTKD